jgi:hypothetical protein
MPGVSLSRKLVAHLVGSLCRLGGSGFNALGLIVALQACAFAAPSFAAVVQASSEVRLNNLVSELLDARSVSEESTPFSFQRATDGWIVVAVAGHGKGTVRVLLDEAAGGEIIKGEERESPFHADAMRFVKAGVHSLKATCAGGSRIDHLEVRGIPELMHCGLGFDPAIKGYGHYDLEFLKADILPNVTTLIVPSQIQLPESQIQSWHDQGKRFLGEVGLDSQAKTAADHFRYWTSFYDKAPFLDGIIVDEFIVNRPVIEWAPLTPERLDRMEKERQQYAACAEAIRRLRADERYRNKTFCAYVGGSGKKLNQEIIGTNFIRSLIDCGYNLALERYLHEMSSPKGSQEALHTFVDGIQDWESKEPGVKPHLVIAFGLFSMPPGGINKQPNVDFHVWMDQQMKVVANDPAFSGIAGLNWWTSSLADEETVRFVGKLYRHYAIEGKRDLLTKDPLFLTHIQNADFENGTNRWTLHSAEEGTLASKSFPRYGRIEGRYMGLGRPADPEHIGDTFLWMKRSRKAPNSFSQIIQDLQPGRLYSMKMFSCDYQDLVKPTVKKQGEATPFMGSVVLDGVDLDAKRSFTEMYSSSPEPKIPVWITYHWKVFRARGTTARVTVSDWPVGQLPAAGFGQEQAFNFLEIQPYWD